MMLKIFLKLQVSPLVFKLKKEKNPKRVAAGKKGVEARMIKAELRRKEEELLRKENLELKEIKQITRDEDQPMFKDEEITIVKQDSDKDSKKDYKLLLCLTIGIGGLGLYFYHNPSLKNLKNVSPLIPIVPKKKEIDPFEFN